MIIKRGRSAVNSIQSHVNKIDILVNNAGYSVRSAVEAITEAARYETRDMGIEICVIEPGAMDTRFFKTLSKNSDEKMNNPLSEYRKIYERDLTFRKKQTRSDVSSCARRLVHIDRCKKLKVRYTIGVSQIYKLFIRMPDGVKEWGIRRFN